MRDRSMKTRKCPVCKTEFTTNRINRVYCSHKCQMMHYYDEKYDKEQIMLKENEQLNDFKKKNAELVEKIKILTKENDSIADNIKDFAEGRGKIITENERFLTLRLKKRDNYVVYCYSCKKQHDLDGTTYLNIDKLEHKFYPYCEDCFKRERSSVVILETDKNQTTLNLPE